MSTVWLVWTNDEPTPRGSLVGVYVSEEVAREVATTLELDPDGDVTERVVEEEAIV